MFYRKAKDNARARKMMAHERSWYCISGYTYRNGHYARINHNSTARHWFKRHGNRLARHRVARKIRACDWDGVSAKDRDWLAGYDMWDLY